MDKELLTLLRWLLPNLGPTATSTGDWDTVIKQLWLKSRVLSPAKAPLVKPYVMNARKSTFELS